MFTLTIRARTLVAFLVIAAVSAGSGVVGVLRTMEVRDSIAEGQTLKAEAERIAQLRAAVVEQELHLKRFIMTGERSELAEAQEHTPDIEALAAEIGAATGIDGAVEAWRAWIDNHVSRVIEHMKRPGTIDLARLEESTGPGLAHLDAFHEQAAAVEQRLTETLSSAAAREMAQIADARAVVLGGAAIVVGLAVLLGLLNYRLMARIGRTMAEMEAGHVEEMAADARRRDEIGSMARAAESFRAKIAEIERAETERKTAEAAAAADRAAMLERLQSQFGAVVAAGVAGDFSKRIDARFDDDVLTTLAQGVNDLMQSVDRGVGTANIVAERLAEGDLTVTMNGAFDGAFGQLQTSLNTALGKLHDLVAEIVDSVDATEQSAGAIQRNADDLSGRVESQAASLEETAATMAEMTATIRTNADNAGRATQMANDTIGRARHGGEVVNETMAAMDRIEESSTKISNIISLIDGIAFQTNLLALNAAVEAARAGEAGKGFAVVAAEVRGLAQRATGAAKEISTLIRQSSTEVGGGVDLMKRTREALEQMTVAVEDVAAVIGDISTASREQASGVDEITNAVTEMDQLTQQNAAMADNTAGSARDLVANASRLSDAVRFFRTNRSPNAGRAARAA